MSKEVKNHNRMDQVRVSQSRTSSNILVLRLWAAIQNGISVKTGTGLRGLCLVSAFRHFSYSVGEKEHDAMLLCCHIIIIIKHYHHYKINNTFIIQFSLYSTSQNNAPFLQKGIICFSNTFSTSSDKIKG